MILDYSSSFSLLLKCLEEILTYVLLCSPVFSSQLLGTCLFEHRYDSSTSQISSVILRMFGLRFIIKIVIPDWTNTSFRPVSHLFQGHPIHLSSQEGNTGWTTVGLSSSHSSVHVSGQFHWKVSTGSLHSFEGQRDLAGDFWSETPSEAQSLTFAFHSLFFCSVVPSIQL